MRCLSSTTQVPLSAERAFLWAARRSTPHRLMPTWAPFGRFDASDGVVELPRIVRRAFPAQREIVEEVIGTSVLLRITQRFSPIAGGSLVYDQLEYTPTNALCSALRSPTRVLEALAAFRSLRTRIDLERHARQLEAGLRSVAVDGEGPVARRLRAFLDTGGHQVLHLSSDPDTDAELMPGFREPPPVSGFDALIYFCSFRRASWYGRPQPSGALMRLRQRVHELLRMPQPPPVVLLVTTVGIYGDRGEQRLREHASLGRGELPRWAAAAEQACEPLIAAGLRVVHLRMGSPLGRDGGLLPRLQRVMRVGLGAGISPGDQFWSWIAADDAVGAIHQALFDEGLRGPVNVTSPVPVRAGEVAQTLASILQRRPGLRWPTTAIRTAIGSAHAHWLTASIRAEPRVLLERGFEFALPNLERALRFELGRIDRRAA